MSTKNFNDVINEGDDFFKSIEIKQPTFEDLPEGVYVANIMDYEFNMSKNGNHQLVVKTRIEGPTHVGKRQNLYHVLEMDTNAGKNGLKRLKRLMTCVGLNPESLSLKNIEKDVEAFKNKKINIEVVKAGGNTFFNTRTYKELPPSYDLTSDGDIF